MAAQTSYLEDLDEISNQIFSEASDGRSRSQASPLVPQSVPQISTRNITGLDNGIHSEIFCWFNSSELHSSLVGLEHRPLPSPRGSARPLPRRPLPGPISSPGGSNYFSTASLVANSPPQSIRQFPVPPASPANPSLNGSPFQAYLGPQPSPLHEYPRSGGPSKGQALYATAFADGIRRPPPPLGYERVTLPRTNTIQQTAGSPLTMTPTDSVHCGIRINESQNHQKANLQAREWVVNDTRQICLHTSFR